jgi:RNA polymerase sigma-70 factor (ECF subfamily)
LRDLSPDEKEFPLTKDLRADRPPVMARTTDRRRRERFERTALPHLDAAYSLARWLTRNDADAGDVVQEAFLRAFRYFDSYQGGDAKSWLLRIVRHTCYSWLARNRPVGVVSLDAEDEFGGAAGTASIDAEALLESRSDLQRLDRLLEALPAPLRETIVLRELHELGYREIAEVTGVPLGTVMSRLHRARSRLLGAFGGAPGAPAALPGQQVSPRDARNLSGSPTSFRTASI